MPDTSLHYSREFYNGLQNNVLRSARRVVPIINNLIQPGSVVDIGCGLGTWLSVFREEGVDDIFGVDGHGVKQSLLTIESQQFNHWDLRQRLELDRTFDLVVCLEVAEHLPAASARTLVKTLTGLGHIVLFSAAIPGQGGTKHINEQWPDYWANLFSEFGYRGIDCIRKLIWDDEEVAWWYAQNMILYANERAITSNETLKSLSATETNAPISLIHPKLQAKLDWAVKTAELAELLNCLPAEIRTVAMAGANELFFETPVRIKVLPFMEKNGQFWGLPENDAQAIMEVERLRELGVDAFGFSWSAFWQLQQCEHFAHHLYSKYRTIHDDNRLRMFTLKVK